MILTLIKRLLTRRLLKAFVWVILFLGTAITLFYVEENWRGARAYQKAKQAYLEKGGTLNLTDILPPPVESPDDNFCALPAFLNLQEEIKTFSAIWHIAPERRSRSRELALDRREYKPGTDLWGADSWRLDRTDQQQIRWHHAAHWMRDALGWVPEDSQLSSAEQVLLGLRQFDSLINRFAEGLDRPYAQFIPRLDQRRDGVLLLKEAPTHAWICRATMHLLQLRGMAAAESRRGDIVFESLAIMTKFQQAISNEARIIEFSFSIEGLRRVCSVLHTALQHRVLTTHQLADLQNRFSQAPMTPQADRVRMAELLGYLELWDYLKTTGNDVLSQWSGGKALPWKVRLAPAGWWDLFKADLLQNGVSGQPFYPYEYAPNWPPDYRNLSNQTQPSLVKKHQMEIACALERHFLDHGTYPENLQSLTPNYLIAVPMDIDDQPMRYRRTPDGRYAIYSVGFNRTDDGNTATRGWPFRGDYKGDWTWRY